MNKETRRVLIQVGLFILTFITTTFAGAQWAYGKTIFSPDYTWEDFKSGLSFSVPLLLFLSVHEFGHYFTAIYHRVRSSLPYYIPVPPIPFMLHPGTFGAVIRLRSKPYTNHQVFDIGVAGPLAGFVVACALLVYGMKTLPPADYIFTIHPEYEQYGADYAQVVYDTAYLRANNAGDINIGKNLIFLAAEQLAEDPARVPNSHELMHYPLLFAVYLALLITSLNLFPLGQFDGGHVVYGLFGYKKHRIIATAVFLSLVFYAGLNNPWIRLTLPPSELLLNTAIYSVFIFLVMRSLRYPLQKTLMVTLVIVAGQLLLALIFPQVEGYAPWLVLIFLWSGLVGIYHPPAEIELPMDPKRVLLGWITLIIFAICFSPAPFSV